MRWSKRLVAVSLLLALCVVMLGAYVRLSDAGLGCPDWPGCYGELSPLGARAEISAAQAAQPTGPVTFGKAWIEMLHRYLATGVGTLILVLAANTAFNGFPVLGSILTVIATSKDTAWASLLLVTYAVGAAIPMLIMPATICV